MKTYLTNRDRERGAKWPACRVESRRGGRSRAPVASGEPAYNTFNNFNNFNDCNDCNNFIIFFIFFSAPPTPSLARLWTLDFGPWTMQSLAHPGIRLFSLILTYSRLTAANISASQVSSSRRRFAVSAGPAIPPVYNSNNSNNHFLIS